MAEFTLYIDILDRLEKKKEEGYEVNKPSFYFKYKSALTREHSVVVGFIILQYMKDNDEELYGELMKSRDEVMGANGGVAVKQSSKEKKVKGLLDGKIYGNERVYSGKELGEIHDFNNFPLDLIEILDTYYELYEERRKEITSLLGGKE